MLGSVLWLWMAACPAHARADTSIDKKHRYRISLGTGWRPKTVAGSSLAPLIGYEHKPSRALLAISRINYPNLDAWRKKTREAYLDQVVEGVEASVKEFRRMARRSLMLGEVPALDLVFQHQTVSGREVVLMRFLFFRRYVLALAVTVPGRAYEHHKRDLREAHESFEPYLEP